MTSYKGTFVKKDGTLRTMWFVKIEDLPNHMIDGMIKGTGKKLSLSEGSETVYDLDSKQIRIFNHYTVVGEVLKVELDNNDLLR